MCFRRYPHHRKCHMMMGSTLLAAVAVGTVVYVGAKAIQRMTDDDSFF
ncbi:MAG: hypothetical protein H6Q74_2171 [Firmicutes bacterium]|nr:hypothetical protein [Bacillota bacterium]